MPSLAITIQLYNNEVSLGIQVTVTSRYSTNVS